MSTRPKSFQVTLADIQEARKNLSVHLPDSPLLFNPWLSDQYQCEIYLKLENMQPIGSFKIRGATNKILRLSREERNKGVICASAGNHAQGVAWGSRLLKTDALIVMPRGASLTKIANTKSLGAKVQLEGANYDEAFEAAQAICKKTGRVYVHAYEDPDVIAGQGTVALEILDQLPGVGCVIGSMGGGGLMSGVSVAFRELKPKTLLIGCQAAGAPSMVQSIQKGRAISLPMVKTFADGIAVARASEVMRRILSPRLDAVYEATDEEISAAVLTLIEKAKTLSEGSGAVPLAILDKIRKKISGKKVVLIISGGNIDVNILARIIDRGLTRAGRRLRLNVLLSDAPGSLFRLTEIIAHEGGNILQAIHDRNEPSTMIDQTDIALTLETRGPDHSDAIIEALKQQVYRVEVLR